MPLSHPWNIQWQPIPNHHHKNHWSLVRPTGLPSPFPSPGETFSGSAAGLPVIGIHGAQQPEFGVLLICLGLTNHYHDPRLWAKCNRKSWQVPCDLKYIQTSRQLKRILFGTQATDCGSDCGIWSQNMPLVERCQDKENYMWITSPQKSLQLAGDTTAAPKKCSHTLDRIIKEAT